MARKTIRYDADTISIRCGYGATRYDTLVRDNDGSLPPDRVREPIKASPNLYYSRRHLPFGAPGPRAHCGSWRRALLARERARVSGSDSG